VNVGFTVSGLDYKGHRCPEGLDGAYLTQLSINDALSPSTPRSDASSMGHHHRRSSDDAVSGDQRRPTEGCAGIGHGTDDRAVDGGA
jgi:hypothetical protein